METKSGRSITIDANVNAGIDKVWDLWTKPEHITKWNNASPDWHSPKAENDLRQGGNFNIRMEAKDGSFGFDFGGVYDKVEKNKTIAYTLGDGRKVETSFAGDDQNTSVRTVFEPESQNSEEMQRGGWQAILDNFKKYAES